MLDKHIRFIKLTADDTIGYTCRKARKQWYDQECRNAATAKDAAYRKTLQSAATRATWENYSEKRKTASRISRRKMRELEKQEREELEMSRNIPPTIAVF